MAKTCIPIPIQEQRMQNTYVSFSLCIWSYAVICFWYLITVLCFKQQVWTKTHECEGYTHKSNTHNYVFYTRFQNKLPRVAMEVTQPSILAGVCITTLHPYVSLPETQRQQDLVKTCDCYNCNCPVAQRSRYAGGCLLRARARVPQHSRAMQ